MGTWGAMGVDLRCYLSPFLRLVELDFGAKWMCSFQLSINSFLKVLATLFKALVALFQCSNSFD